MVVVENKFTLETYPSIKKTGKLRKLWLSSVTMVSYEVYILCTDLFYVGVQDLIYVEARGHIVHPVDYSMITS